MTGYLDQSQIDPPSETNTAARYDKLIEGGITTRFVKGRSGNPSGRPKRQPIAICATELIDRIRRRSGRV